MINRLPSITSSRHYLPGTKQLWLRLSIAIGVLLLSGALAFRVSPYYLKSLVGLLAGIGGVLVLLRWPPLGLFMLAFGGMVIPFTGPNGLNFSILLVMLMLALWLMAMIGQQRRIRLVPSRTTLPLLAFVAIAFLSFAVGQFSWFNFAQNAPLNAQLGGLAIFVLSAGAFLLAANQMRDLRWLQAMTWVFLAFGGLFVIGRAVPVLVPMTRVVFQAQSIGGIFWAWLPAIAISQALVNRKLRLEWRVGLVIMTLLTLYVAYVLNYRWKSGWLPSFVAVGVVIMLYSWRAGVVLALVASLPVWRLIPELLASDAYSLETRLDAWIILVEIVRASPVLGLGFANYYWYTPLFRIRGWLVNFNSHNNYVDIVAQTGLLGLIAFLWLFWECGWLAWRLRDRVPEGFARAYVYGTLGGLVGTLVAAMLGDWVLSFVYNIGLAGFKTGVLAWLFLGGLVAVEQLYANHTDKED